jgi:hypothetical protein
MGACALPRIVFVIPDTDLESNIFFSLVTHIEAFTGGLHFSQAAARLRKSRTHAGNYAKIISISIGIVC